MAKTVQSQPYMNTLMTHSNFVYAVCDQYWRIGDDGLGENTLGVLYNRIRIKVQECQNVVISDSMFSGMPLPEFASSNHIYPTVCRPISSAPECSYVEQAGAVVQR